ncbi:MAG: acetylglutamate kinase [Alphaproteobacteria bacterium]|nr:acetylglutamate kinase [Alphaproteobacteria bacterium]
MTEQTPAPPVADLLLEALPFMQRYRGAVFVIKYGGHALGNEQALSDFAQNIVLLKQVGIHPVVVHGGGPQIDATLKRLNIPSQFVAGRRVTDAATMEVVEMVLAGPINKQIVQAIHRAGGRAVGLSGKDGQMIMARKLKLASPTVADDDIDLGLVGEPVAVRVDVLQMLMQADVIPVVAPVAGTEENETLNINADTAAGALAAALKARRFFLLTDVAGVLDGDKKLIRALTADDAARLMADGTIHGGMIPKVETCLHAVHGGVEGAVILSGKQPHQLLVELFTANGAGTLVRA